MQNADANTNPERAMYKIIMTTLGERDYAAQETMHHLFSLKLHSSSFTACRASASQMCSLRRLQQPSCRKSYIGDSGPGIKPIILGMSKLQGICSANICFSSAYGKEGKVYLQCHPFGKQIPGYHCLHRRESSG